MLARRGKWALLAALACGLMLPGCSEPDGVELFLRREEVRGGVYVFTLPLKDTTAAYDFWFYTRSTGRRLDNVRLNAQWLDPAGDGLSESVYLRTVSPDGTKELYRSGMVPARAGDWQLSVRPVDAADEILGLGVICKKKEHGTR
ncbi:hypothetical protein SAMN06298214_0677 [Bacteroidales bacterium WCE2004]|nr:hypothetical protein SAMN06298214_0677 [Bacteroidales bacterium WCE2004]